MIRAARTYASERRRLGFAACCRQRANRKHDALRGQENDGGIAMLMIRWSVRVVVGCGIRAMMMVMHATLFMISGAKLDIAGERIGEMNMVMGVVDPVH